MDLPVIGSSSKNTNFVINKIRRHASIWVSARNEVELKTDKEMKKYISILILAALVSAMCLQMEAEAKKKEVKTSDIVELVSDYRSEDGFEAVVVGKFAMGLVKSLAKMSMDKEDRDALKVISGIKKVVVAEYEDAAPETRDEFNKKATALLDKAEKILEAKDDGDTVHIYGTLAKSGEAISDIIIHVPTESTLVCLLGSISANDISKLMEMSNE